MRTAVERARDIPSGVEAKSQVVPVMKDSSCKFSIFLNLYKPFLCRNNQNNGSGEIILNLHKD